MEAQDGASGPRSGARSRFSGRLSCEGRPECRRGPPLVAQLRAHGAVDGPGPRVAPSRGQGRPPGDIAPPARRGADGGFLRQAARADAGRSSAPTECSLSTMTVGAGHAEPPRFLEGGEAQAPLRAGVPSSSCGPPAKASTERWDGRGLGRAWEAVSHRRSGWGAPGTTPPPGPG